MTRSELRNELRKLIREVIEEQENNVNQQKKLEYIKAGLKDNPEIVKKLKQLAHDAAKELKLDEANRRLDGEQADWARMLRSKKGFPKDSVATSYLPPEVDSSNRLILRSKHQRATPLDKINTTVRGSFASLIVMPLLNLPFQAIQTLFGTDEFETKEVIENWEDKIKDLMKQQMEYQKRERDKEIASDKK